jgi:hypothetical protein
MAILATGRSPFVVGDGDALAAGAGVGAVAPDARWACAAGFELVVELPQPASAKPARME